MKITHEQALKAASMVIEIVNEVFPEGERPMATEIRLHHTQGEAMRELVEEMRAEDKSELTN